jgi:membrane protein DedA with SNARE-associated domain
MESLFEHLASLTPTSVYCTLGGILLFCGLGLPVPEDISLIAAGYMAHIEVVNVHTVFVVSLAAVLGGDLLAFFVGSFFGPRVLDSRLFRRVFSPRKQMRVRAYFRKYGSKVIFVGRFLPGLRFSIFFSAGTMGVRPTTFILYDSLAAAISVPTLVYLAWYFGEHIDRVGAWARRSEYGILVVAAVAALLIVLKTYRRRGKPTASAEPPVPSEPPPPVPPPPRPPANGTREKSAP